MKKTLLEKEKISKRQYFSHILPRKILQFYHEAGFCRRIENDKIAE